MKDKVILFDGENLAPFLGYDTMVLAPTGRAGEWPVCDGAITVTKYDMYSEY